MADTKDLKKFRGGIRLDASTDTAPANAEVGAMYVDTNGTLKIYNGSAWDSVGSGAGTTNYIDTPSSKVDSIDNFNTYKDAVQATPEDGTAGTSTITTSKDTTSALRGINSLKVSSTTADEQGEGISIDFSIDAADKAKKLLISFDYTTSAGYADDDMGIFIYDVTNTNLIRVNGEDLKAVSGTGKHYAQFQTASNSTSYRLILHMKSASTTSFDVHTDNIKVEPQNISHGTPSTEWESYTPTLNSDTNVSAKYAQYRRVGDSIEVKFAVKYSGQGHSSGWTLALPSGLTFDTAKMPQVAEADGVGFLGSCAWYNAGTGTSDLQVAYSTTTAVHIFGDIREIVAGHGDGSGDESTNFLQSNYLYTNDYVSGTFTAPISGWTANTQMSEDFSGRDVVFSASNSSATSIATATAVLLTYDTGEIDTTNSMSAGTYTVPEKGYYDISYQVTFAPTADWDAGELGYSYIVHNSTTKKLSSIIESQASTADVVYMGVQTTCILDCEKGDTLKFYIRQETGATLTLQADVNQNYISIAKRSSPQTILENETVACRYTSNDSQSIAHATETVVTYEDVDFDTHNGFSTSATNSTGGTGGVYTIPVTGYYNISSRFTFADFAGAAGKFARLTIRKDGVSWAEDLNEYDATNSAKNHHLDVTDMGYFTKGQTVEINIYQDSGGAEAADATSHRSTFSIAKIK